MRTQKGQNACPESKGTNYFNPKEEEFLNDIRFHGVRDLIKSLKMAHDFALYHTDICLDKEEKSALFNLKILWEGLEQLENP